MSVRLSPASIRFSGFFVPLLLGLGATIAVLPRLITPETVILGAIGVVTLAVSPPLAMVVMILGVEEQLSSAAAGDELVPPLVRVGSSAIFGGTIPRATLLLLAVGGFVLIKSRFRLHPSTTTGLLAASSIWALTLTVMQGGIPSIAAALSWPLALAGYLVGRSARAKDIPLIAIAGTTLIVGKALVGLLSLSLLRGTVEGSHYLVFYDSALAGFAGATLITAVYVRRFQFRFARPLLVASSLLVLGLSLRRSVWLATAVVALIVPLTSRQPRLLVRLAAYGFVLAVAGSAVVPQFASEATERVTSALTTLRGEDSESSTVGHVSDLEIGLQAAKTAPVIGIGSLAPQLPGLASSKTNTLYVHNEFLQTWLRFGLPGLVLLVLMVGAAALTGIRYLRSGGRDPILVWTSVFLLLIPVISIAFPILTRSVRWPALFGIALGLMDAERRRVTQSTNRSVSSLPLTGTPTMRGSVYTR